MPRTSAKRSRSGRRLARRYLTEREGQFLERKSCFDLGGPCPKPLPWRRVAAEAAETLVAFANADGGELVVGVDDDGTPSGLPYSPRRIAKIEQVSRSRISPPLAVVCRRCAARGVAAIVMEVGPSGAVHRTTGGKYLYRDRDQNLLMDAERIAHLKALKREALTEHVIIPGAGSSDLSLRPVGKVARALQKGLSGREALARLRLAEKVDGGLRLTYAALLLFAKDCERWHPKAYVEYLRFRGTSRKHGRELNVVERKRIAAPLVDLPRRVTRLIRRHIGRRQILHDLFFSERFEYPEFAWQEAVINAVAHRDYGLRGTPIEIHHYDDRLEIVSPGAPVPPIALETLRQGGGGHASRNPLVVRVFTLMGLMREVGEGVPRMFAEMAANGLHAPEFEGRPPGCLTVILRNTPVWDEKTRKWLAGFKAQGLTAGQMRLLAFAREHGDRFTSAQYQKLLGTDIYSASRDIKDLIRKGLARPERKRGRVYRLCEKTSSAPKDFQGLAVELKRKGALANRDLCEIFGVNRQAALRRAKRLVELGWLRREGSRRGTRYLPGPRAR